MNTVDTAVSAEDFFKQGEVKAETGNYIEAMQDYNQALLLNPNDAKAYGNRGLARLQLGDQRGALEDFQTSARLFLNQGSLANYQVALGYVQKLR
jgi:Flp pilus assembly protein TadD